jgi:PD-(D/E)XK nuclease superfamily
MENLKILNGINDETMETIKAEKGLPYSELTGSVLRCCFEVMRELGPGFLEKIYKNALFIAMRQKGLQIEVERPYEVVFRGKIIGRFRINATLIYSYRSHRYIVFTVF